MSREENPVFEKGILKMGLLQQVPKMREERAFFTGCKKWNSSAEQGGFSRKKRYLGCQSQR